MKKVDIEKILEILENFYPTHVMEDSYIGNPYKALVSCLLSLRTRDEITFPIAEKLFQVADTPEKMVKLPYDQLCSIIKSINYYKTKAEKIQHISQVLIDDYNSKIPDTIDELLVFRGVGRKTANIVLSVGFQKPAIAVDTHVHRISNRLGYVTTKKPDETEFELRKKLPQKCWRPINSLFVLHGRATCKPIGPRCGSCPIIDFCNQIII